MFKQKCAVLIILAVAVATLALPAMVFAVDKASKDAILQELSVSADKDPEILRGVIFSMADAYQRDNKVDEAVALYEKALKVLPDDENFLTRLGDLYSNKTEFAKAAEIFKKLTELKPENTWYFQRLSDAYRNAGDNDKAAGVWEGLTQKSTNPEVFIQAANFYSNIEDLEKSIAMVKKATELAPDNIGYLQSLESFYTRAEKYADAEAVCNKVLAGAKDQWAKDWANSELINIYQRQEKLDELASRFEKDLAAATGDLSQYKKLADLYQRSDQRDKAIAVYEKAVQAGVADRDTDNRLLDLYEWSGKSDKAEAQIKKIIALAPEETYLYERYANLLAGAKKVEEAKKVWKELLAKVPNDAAAASRFADRLNGWGETDAAIEQYKKAQSLDPGNLWYTLRVVDILINNNRFDQAKKDLDGIVSGAKDEWMRNEAKRRLDNIAVRVGEVKAAEAAAKVEAPGPKAEASVSDAAPPIIFEESKKAEESKTEAAAKKEEPKKGTKKKRGGWFGR